jgi:hypothetical protein
MLTNAMPIPPPIAFERFRAFFRLVIHAMTTMRCSNRLTAQFNSLAFDRLRRISELLARIATRVQAGRYRPRRGTGRPRRRTARRPRAPDPLPRKFGWLAMLLPDTAAGHRGDLCALLDEPATVALIGAAPVTLIPPLRSLCWALKLRPPPILARPRRPAPPPDKAPAAEAVAPQPPPPTAPPSVGIAPAPPVPTVPDPPKTA